MLLTCFRNHKKRREPYLIESVMTSKGLSPEFINTASIAFEVCTLASPKRKHQHQVQFKHIQEEHLKFGLKKQTKLTTLNT